MILETIEPYVEIVNFVIALAIVIAGIFVSFKLGGVLKKAWNYFLVAILLFGVHEVVGILTEFELINVDGLYAFTELLYVVALLVAIFSFGKILSGFRGKK